MATSLIPSAEAITDFLKYTPVKAIQNWLRMNGKTYSTLNNANVGKKINKWISDDEITLDDVNSIVYDIEENGGKKVYLRVLSGGVYPKTKTEFDAFLAASSIPLIARTRRTVRQPQAPTLNHIIWENSCIIIKYSESQEDINFNSETEEYDIIHRPIYCIIKLDVQSGFCEIRFDLPAKRHRHKDSEGKSNTNAFENFYFDKIKSLFPGIEIEIFGLTNIADFIVKEGDTLFRLNREQVTTTGNGKQLYSVGSGDVRDLPARIGANERDGDNWIVDDITGFWKAQEANGELLSDLFMRLSQEESSLRFQRDCLGVELNYAIRKIRSIKEEIQGV